MADLGALERRLERLDPFPQPRLALEQYPTPAPLAARLLHTAGLQGDLEGQTVIDLGAGTGVLAIGAVLAGAQRVLALEIDPSALRVARQNERTVVATGDGDARVDGSPGAGLSIPVEWLQGDAIRPPLPASEHPTVVMNPPFGARDGNEGADRAFLATASAVAGVSYSVHNDGSFDFLESFATDRGGRVTHAFEAALPMERTFDFHASDRQDITVVVARIDWTGDSGDRRA